MNIDYLKCMSKAMDMLFLSTLIRIEYPVAIA